MPLLQVWQWRLDRRRPGSPWRIAATQHPDHTIRDDGADTGNAAHGQCAECVVGGGRSGRVFFAEDAAHVTTPYDGFGMNCGIADAGNLAWKLVAVHHGWARETLLDTYEAERRPVAVASPRKATGACSMRSRRTTPVPHRRPGRAKGWYSGTTTRRRP